MNDRRLTVQMFGKSYLTKRGWVFLVVGGTIGSAAASLFMSWWLR